MDTPVPSLTGMRRGMQESFLAVRFLMKRLGLEEEAEVASRMDHLKTMWQVTSDPQVVGSLLTMETVA